MVRQVVRKLCSSMAYRKWLKSGVPLSHASTYLHLLSYCLSKFLSLVVKVFSINKLTYIVICFVGLQFSFLNTFWDPQS